MATRTISTRLSLEGGAEIRQQLQQIGQTGEDAFQKLKAAGQTANIDKVQNQAKQLGDNLKQAGQAGQQAGQQIAQGFNNGAQNIQQANQQAGGFLTTLGKVGIVLGTAAAGVAAAFSAATTKMANDGAELALKLQTAADKLGITTGALQRLQNQADEAGADPNQVTDTLAKLQQEALKAIGNVAQATKSFKVSSETVADGVKSAISDPIKEAAKDAEDDMDEADTEVEKSADNMTESLKKPGEAAKQTTVTVRDLGKELSTAASNGQSMSYQVDGVTISVNRLHTTTQDAKKATLDVGDAFKALGINLQQFTQLDAEAQLQKLRDAFNSLPDGLQKDRVAVALFKDNWRDMLTVMSQSSDEVTAANNKLAASGRALTSAEVKNLLDYKNAKSDFDKSLEATTAKIGALFAPGKTASFKWLTDLIDKNRQWLLDLAATKKAQLETFFSDTFGQNPLEGMLTRLQDLGRQAATVWNSVLLPAIKAVDDGFTKLADFINSKLGTSFTGRFLQIALAVTALVVAFTPMGTVISAVSGAFAFLIALLTPFAPLLIGLGVIAAVFWKDIKANGLDAYNALKGAGATFGEGLKLLFQGDFAGAWAKFKEAGLQAYADLKAAFPNAFEFIESIPQKFETARKAIAEIAATIGELWDKVKEKLDGAAKGLNDTFNTQFTGEQVGAALVLTSMAGKADLLTKAIVAAGVALNELRSISSKFEGSKFDLFDNTLRELNGIADAAKKVWSELFGSTAANAAEGKAAPAGSPFAQIETEAKTAVETVQKAFADMKPDVQPILEALAPIKDGIAGIGTGATDAATVVQTAAQDMVTAFNSVADAADRAAQSAGSIGSGGSGSSSPSVTDPGSGFADGGHVRGPGTSTSDSIAAWLSDGEFVIRAAAVKRYGVSLLHAINSMRFGVPRFATGGLVSAPSVKLGLPAFSMGGLVSALTAMPAMPTMGMAAAGAGGGGLHPVHLNIGGQTVVLQGETNAVQQLMRAANHKKLTSGGRKPNWTR